MVYFFVFLSKRNHRATPPPRVSRISFEWPLVKQINSMIIVKNYFLKLDLPLTFINWSWIILTANKMHCNLNTESILSPVRMWNGINNYSNWNLIPQGQKIWPKIYETTFSAEINIFFQLKMLLRYPLKTVVFLFIPSWHLLSTIFGFNVIKKYITVTLFCL